MKRSGLFFLEIFDYGWVRTTVSISVTIPFTTLMPVTVVSANGSLGSNVTFHVPPGTAFIVKLPLSAAYTPKVSPADVAIM